MAHLNENVKVALLKGEKGDTGYPTDEQVQAQVTDWIEKHPESTIDEDIIVRTANEYLDTHPVNIKDGSIEDVKLSETGIKKTVNDLSTTLTTRINNLSNTVDTNNTTITNKLTHDITNVTVSANSFTAQTHDTPTNYTYRATISNTNIKANDVCELFPSQNTNDLGILSCECDSFNGGVYIYASEVPSTNLVFNRITIRKENA